MPLPHFFYHTVSVSLYKLDSEVKLALDFFFQF